MAFSDFLRDHQGLAVKNFICKRLIIFIAISSNLSIKMVKSLRDCIEFHDKLTLT